jgi:cysteine desulfurase/selenocysteine lyase
MTEILPVRERVDDIRLQFPALERRVHDKELVYLDNGASSQKPESVIHTMDDYYRCHNANVHRGAHTMSEEATTMYENARLRVARFINAPSDKQIIFTRGTTEGINLVAHAWAGTNCGPGDEVLITEMEHHSNIVPWQIVQERAGFTLRYIPIADDGTLDLSNLDELLNERTRLLSFIHMSNVLGTINPAQKLIDAAHAVGAVVLVDGAQSVPHMPIDVQAMDVDFMVFSGHKMCGPTGIGVLYGRRELLEAMPPFMGGGDMIREVKMSGSTWAGLPYKFEAGTPAIAQAIGLGAAVDYLSEVGMEWIHEHEAQLARYAYAKMSMIEDLRILGPGPEERGGIISFTVEGVHPHDLSAILDREGVAVRAGHHCAQPIHDRYDIASSARASMYLYNTMAEIDKLAVATEKAIELFAF